LFIKTKRLPEAVRNPIALVGMATATATAVVFLTLLGLEFAGVLTNPYLGLLVFVTLPVLFVAALLLIPAGAWRAARRRRRGLPAADWPIIDLRDQQQRGIVAGVFGLTIANVLIVSLGAYGGVHYMESTSFCGQVCHTTMEPQAVAHRAWPHAGVSCTQCHVGPGAGAFVEAKLAGTRQLWHVITNDVPRPVPPPAQLIQSTRITCAQCHSLAFGDGETLRVIRDFASDSANTETQTRLRLRVGDRFSGIHRHVSMNIEYIATDETRETIPVVRVRDGQRTVREFIAEGAATGTGGVTRTMECADCHNRPAHTFSASPERAIDRALARGAIPRDLPFVRREAAAAIGADYASREQALAGIASRLTRFYQGGTADAASVRRAVDAAQRAWSDNVFPSMNVGWGTYPNQLGHVDSPGCFRCHDDGHKGADGAVIKQDCELCHSVPE
jgi:hypothetical protein